MCFPERRKFKHLQNDTLQSPSSLSSCPHQMNRQCEWEIQASKWVSVWQMRPTEIDIPGAVFNGNPPQKPAWQTVMTASNCNDSDDDPIRLSPPPTSSHGYYSKWRCLTQTPNCSTIARCIPMNVHVHKSGNTCHREKSAAGSTGSVGMVKIFAVKLVEEVSNKPKNQRWHP